jgi:hypothetical protein
VEVVHNIVKYLSKLEGFGAGIYNIINGVNTGLTDDVATMIAKRVLQLLNFTTAYEPNDDKPILKQRLRQLLPMAYI